LKLLGLAGFAIVALLLFVFRNPRDVLLVLLPTAFAVTSLTTMLAFGTLTLTSTPAMQSLGRLTALGMRHL
jgi:predicted RND superfamily exporter protein